LVTQDESYSPIPVKLQTYFVVGAGERVDGSAHPWGWESPQYDDRNWSEPRTLGRGNPYGWGTDMDHWLRPRTVPPMEEAMVRFASIRRSSGTEVGSEFVLGRGPIVIPPNTRANVLFDHGVETNAFIQLIASGGRSSRVRITYAEALIDEAGLKGHRDAIDRRRIEGMMDEFWPDGGQRRIFDTLDFRTYRFVEMDVQTADEALRIDDLQGRFTAYPFVERGSFSSDDPELAKIWEVGWRTARLCAFETYVDCPYYEQLQYVADTRIQALISLYVAGDDRLMRNAIEQFDRSRIADGLTQSRYPSVTPQVINTFSLFWIDMVHDFWMHRSDDAFVRDRLRGVQSVLSWFEDRVDPHSGLLGPLDYWTFVDWARDWPWNNRIGRGGAPESARAGGSSAVTLQLAITLRRAAELCRAYGQQDIADRYNLLAGRLRSAVREHCWDETRQLFADSPLKTTFSQHTNTFAVLAGAIEGGAAKELMQRVTSDDSLIQSTTYFRFYVLRAMKEVGLGNEYIAQLGPWRKMLELGLTTFAEQPEPTRSDCHAWSASPVYELLATVCGIESTAPGFSRIRIEPHPGSLRRVQGKVPHPLGDIQVSLVIEADELQADVTLPEGLKGELKWKGRAVDLRSGHQNFRLR
jgi:alpha-L-rhamnosidase